MDLNAGARVLFAAGNDASLYAWELYGRCTRTADDSECCGPQIPWTRRRDSALDGTRDTDAAIAVVALRVGAVNHAMVWTMPWCEPCHGVDHAMVWTMPWCEPCHGVNHAMV